MSLFFNYSRVLLIVTKICSGPIVFNIIVSVYACIGWIHIFVRFLLVVQIFSEYLRFWLPNRAIQICFGKVTVRSFHLSNLVSLALVLFVL